MPRKQATISHLSQLIPKKGPSHMAHICGGIKSAIGIRVSNNLISNNNTDINIHDTIRWQIVRNYDCH